MKNFKHLIIFIFTIFLGCSDESDLDSSSGLNYTISKITPLRGKIGDLITISGTNLNEVNKIFFLHEDQSYFEEPVTVEGVWFESHTNEEITLKIPTLYHENILIHFPIPLDFNFELVGFIPIKNDFTDINQIQILDDNIAFLCNWKQVFKSIDGYYYWTPISDFNGSSITSFYFMDENNGWFGIWEQDNININLYHTIDGGSNFSLKYNVGNRWEIGAIRKIQFSSLSKGFFVTDYQQMYVCDNDSLKNIYDYFPNLSSLPFGKIEIYDFNALNENLIFLAGNRDPIIIKIENQNISYSEFESYPLAPQFFDNIGYVQVNDVIYKSEDLGDSWTKIKTFENYYPQIYFFDKDVGFAMVNYSPEIFYKTTDGGNTWDKYWTPPSTYYNNNSTLVNKKSIWLLRDLWKYIEE